ncbi:MAG: riboflavin synthase, alpha subunit [Myxococcales bacterium]|nr:riboflavin synthase, alpha subunit [Myxococcales bacterium]
MFTGIVEDVGQITQLEPLPSEQALRLTVRAHLLADEQSLGASLAVDGVCLTVTAWRAGEVDAIVGPETIARTTLGKLGEGARVNLERPLRVGDRLGGHMVAGHVDGVGRIASLQPRAEAVDVVVQAPGELLRYVIEKGSIAVDGISLTVNAVDDATFTVSLIPHTQTATTLSDKGLGGVVNLEVDLIGKYVEKLVGGYKK